MPSRFFDFVKAVISFLDNRIEEILIVILCSTLVLCLTFTVIVRYALPIPILSMASHWAEELASFSFIWLLYWGASLATRTGSHFRVTAQIGLLPTRFRRFALLPGEIVWLLFNLVIIKLGWQLVKYSMETSLSLEITMNYVYSIIPLSFMFIFFRLVQFRYKSLRSAIKHEE
jgi:C4-dicarboxylate transporter DctQ subunit